MYEKEEYKKRIEELESVAMDLIKNKSPVEAMEVASKMSPEDAYILGIHVGTILHTTELSQAKEE